MGYGLNTSTVDIYRLLSSLSIKLQKGISQYVVCLDKRAITELKNIIDVKEFQSYWILNHHKVHYDNRILVKAVTKLAGILCNKLAEINSAEESEKDAIENSCLYNLFDYHSFIKEKNYEFQYNDTKCTEFLYMTSDDDIVYLLKKYFISQKDENISYAKEWLHRNYQMIPLWKSYAEFMHTFKDCSFDEDESKTKLYSSVEKTVTAFFQSLRLKKKGIAFQFTKPLLEKKTANPMLIDTDAEPLYINIGEDVLRYSEIPYLTGTLHKSSNFPPCSNNCTHTNKLCMNIDKEHRKSLYWNYFYLFLPKIYKTKTKDKQEISKDDYKTLYKEDLTSQIVKDYLEKNN